MSEVSYVVSIDTDDPDADTDEGMRQAAAHLAETLSPEGRHRLVIDLWRDGRVLSGYLYVPDEFEDNELGEPA